MNDRAFIALLALLPKATMSRAVGAITRCSAPHAWHSAAIRAFSRTYPVDAGEAEFPLDSYATFGDFFARRLKPGMRPIAPGDVVPVSPVDGTVHAFGVALRGRLVQIKGWDYEVEALVGGAEEAKPFVGGAYVTVYLAPHNYHRIHAPLSGRIAGYSYIPGKLWPVSPASVRTVQRLFAQNERLITFLETPLGACAVAKVGATCVGRIRAAYDDVVTNCGAAAKRHRYANPPPIGKGDELGVFEMGSTVIVLFEKGKVELGPVEEGQPIRMGQPIGKAVR